MSAARPARRDTSPRACSCGTAVSSRRRRHARGSTPTPNSPTIPTSQPPTRRALPNGHVQQILATLRALPDDMRSDATRVLLRVGEAHDSTRLAQAARRLKMIADPDGHLAAQLRRDADRWLDIHPLLDGMAAINGLIPMQTAAALRTALDALDQPQPDELRTATQRRADNLGQLLMLCLDADRLPINGGHRPHLTVTVDLASLQIQPYAAPGELDFGESLHPETARRLACDALITRMLTTRQPDADTQPSLPAGLARLYEQLLPPPLRAPSLPLDVGRTERVVPPHIRKALNLRDGGCIFDGCQLPVSWCHAHHRVHWADGGPTAVWNLVLLCPRHHVFAHEKHWQIITTTSGRFRVVPPDAESAGISPALAS